MADRYWIEPGFYEKEPGVLKHIAYLMIVTATSIIMIMGLYLVRQYQNELQRRSEDQILLSEMKISLLYAQLNPHFFFNMLNNIYGVSLTTPDRTPDLLLKLSKLMRYQLENGSKQMVSVSEEINFIDNYIVLEKERVGKRCQITVKFPQPSSIPANYSIAPLILITLVENAFKHSLTIANTWFVFIEMQLSGSTLQLHIRNSLPDVSLRSESIGMGLKNIRQRLELLYRGRYSFDSGISGSEYKTELRLELVR
jgi:LytS/YehU family sensor histidine kinase